jgi:hypothetical protein
LLALQCTLWKPTLFLKRKPCDVYINVFSICVGPLWETNTYAQFVLNSYVVITYCISYLIKVDKFVTREMQYILDKCKIEQTRTFILLLQKNYKNYSQFQQIFHCKWLVEKYK